MRPSAGQSRLRRLTRFHLACTLLAACPFPSTPATLSGRIVDADSGSPLPARLYIQDATGNFHFAQSAEATGTAVRYDKANAQNPLSVERHTTLSPHRFTAALPPGQYTLTAARGKECLPATLTIQAGADNRDVELRLRRWIDMSGRGWFSGDTHVHRSLEDLPNVVAAEDLNVALPLTYWVTQAFTPPSHGDKTSASPPPEGLIRVDATHVIYPRNTEYEIFTVGGRRHTLGAVFVLNHRRPFGLGVPPLEPVVRQARAEGALLDLDKHNWPWSMAIIPIMDVDLFELSNNHVWRASFAFTNWSVPPPRYMGLPLGSKFGPERDWLEFGFQSYYALLNCGYRLRPTAGTASGVHPVPLGHSRVYIHLPNGFNYEDWIQGLGAGRSFVTTGPMILADIDGEKPGRSFTLDATDDPKRLQAEIFSQQPLESVEVIVNGEILKTVPPDNRPGERGGFRSAFVSMLPAGRSCWVAVRCFETRPDNRFRFAHTGPFYLEVEGQPIRPRPEQVEYLVSNVEAEIARSRPVLPAQALAEYERALADFRSKGRN